MRTLVVALILAALGHRASAQARPEKADNVPLPAGARGLVAYSSIEFHFTPLQADAASWSFRIDADRAGQYQSKDGTAPVPVRVSEATYKLLNSGDATVNAHKCETKSRNIAKTGEKNISYAMGPSLATCRFNYSDDSALNEVAAAFQAMAETMRIGAKIAHDRRFDHLGLNADLELLTVEARERRALELQNIAPLLQSIVDNDELMDVVRRKAQSLLQDATLGVAK